MNRNTWIGIVCLVSVAAAALPAAAQTAAQFERARRQMVDEVIVPDGVKDPARAGVDADHAAA